MVAVNSRSGERYVGQVAKRQAVTNPENTLFSVKRLMGRKFDDPEVQNSISKLPYKVVKGNGEDAHVMMAGESYAPPQISSFVLQKIKQDAESKLGEKITQAVITVPAYFVSWGSQVMVAVEPEPTENRSENNRDPHETKEISDG